MKQIILIALFFISCSFNSNAQVNPHAIGLRLGGSHYGYYGGEISYQHGFGDKNRLEIDLGARNHKYWSYLGLAAIFHWDWNLTAGLNWYIGPGAQIGFWNNRGNNGYYRGAGLGIGGQIGLEYDFNHHDVPLLLSLDVRPMWDLLYTNYTYWYGGALGIRYTF
ncbi:MAG: hypothetical protein H6582_04525 [Crocinitomicaceae bacterium]|nr:hypothetical protein [Crocinitomicaceae bacterium]